MKLPDTIRVNVAGATNLESGTPGLLKPTSTLGTDQTATHTAATTGGNTVTGSSNDGTGSAAWYAFDKSTGFFQATTTTGWIRYQFGSAQTAYGYSVTSRSGFADRAPKTWTFEGSNNGSSWTMLDTQTNITSWTGGDTKSYTIATPGSFTYYRLNVSANNGGSLLLVDEMTINGAPVYNNLTVTTTSIAVPAVPSKIIPVARIKHVDAAVAGTDYTIEVSRDGGTTWSTATLTDWYTDPTDGCHVVYGAAVDVSGQPSGSNIRLRVTTANNKNIEIHDWGFESFA